MRPARRELQRLVCSNPIRRGRAHASGPSTLSEDRVGEDNMNRVGSSGSVEPGMSNQREQSRAAAGNGNAGENQVETQAEGLISAGQRDEPQQDEEPD